MFIKIRGVDNASGCDWWVFEAERFHYTLLEMKRDERLSADVMVLDETLMGSRETWKVYLMIIINRIGDNTKDVTVAFNTPVFVLNNEGKTIDKICL